MKIYKVIHSTTQLRKNGVIAFKLKGNVLFKGIFIRGHAKVEETKERFDYLKRK